ncbi:MAG: DUF883 C-terminal domain-containing protein [Pseudomonadota bacterium]
MTVSHSSRSEAPLFPASTDEALAQGQAVKDKAVAAAQSVASAAADDVTRITDWAKEWWQRYATTAMNAAAAVKEETEIVGDHTREFVRERPMQALLIAAGVGALVGSLAVLASQRPRSHADD